MARAEFEELVETFAFLDDWEDRYRHIIDMGKRLPPLDESERVPATKVEGCASQVWLVPELEGEGDAATLRFRGESDAMIVKGLIAVLQTLYNGLTLREAREVDAQAELGRLALRDHLSSQRSNGLKAMVGRIREISARA
jgi:cysteine desulfuration protein SufE